VGGRHAEAEPHLGLRGSLERHVARGHYLINHLISHNFPPLNKKEQYNVHLPMAGRRTFQEKDSDSDCATQVPHTSWNSPMMPCRTVMSSALNSPVSMAPDPASRPVMSRKTENAVQKGNRPTCQMEHMKNRGHRSAEHEVAPYCWPSVASFSSSSMNTLRYFHVTSTSKLAPFSRCSYTTWLGDTSYIINNRRKELCIRVKEISAENRLESAPQLLRRLR
jgi:hypothetical protein